MNKLDTLREELRKRHFKEIQIKSKLVPTILDIILNPDNKYTEIWEEEINETNKLIEIQEKIRKSEENLKTLNDNTRELSRKNAETMLTIEDRIGYMQAYINEFYKTIKTCDTDEGRDTMRKVQVYLDLVDNSRSNDAYINGLARILSQGRLEKDFEFKRVTRTPPYISDVNDNQEHGKRTK
jgi:hypothetical protein